MCKDYKNSRKYFTLWKSQPTYQIRLVCFYRRDMRSKIISPFSGIWAIPEILKPGNRRYMETETHVRMCNSYNMLHYAVAEFKQEPLLCCCHAQKCWRIIVIFFLRNKNKVGIYLESWRITSHTCEMKVLSHRNNLSPCFCIKLNNTLNENHDHNHILPFSLK